MRRFLFAIALVVAVSFASCSDDEPGYNYVNPYPLNGTRWISTILENSTDDIRILDIKETTYRLSITSNVSGSSSTKYINGKYTYIAPVVVFIPNDVPANAVMVGEVNGQVIVIDGEGKYPFVKQ